MVIVLFTSCTSTATMKELENKEPQEQIKIDANYRCLYVQGVEYISELYPSPKGFFDLDVDPPFTFFIDDQKKLAWFKKPHTLVKIEYLDDETSLVTKTSIMHGDTWQADQLVHFLSHNPCK